MATRKYRFVLDAGHGGNTGAHGGGLIEDEVAYDFVTRIGHHLRAAGHQTILTRPTSKFVALANRVRVALSSKATTLISIHLNASVSSAARGWEAYVAFGATDDKRAANYLLSHITGEPIRGVKWDSQSQYNSLYILKNTWRPMTSILLECGFVSNPTDDEEYKDPRWMESKSIQIANALIGIAGGGRSDSI